jgi:hypothetical protein
MIDLLTLATIALLTAPPQQTQVITTAPNVRIRTGPSTASDVVREESLGSVHNVVQRTADGWLQLEFGYVREELTAPITDETRQKVIEEVIRTRLAQGEAGFEAWNQLLALTGHHVMDTDRETAARFALYELKALRGAADAASGVFRTRFAFALAQDSAVFVYHEPAGQWIVRAEHIRAVRDQFKDTAAADDIAWFAVENGLPGECEGWTPCYVTLLDRLQGEYLRQYPSGRHVDAALARIVKVFAFTGDPRELDRLGMPKADVCKELAPPLSALAAAVAPVRADGQPEAAAAIARLASGCR